MDWRAMAGAACALAAGGCDYVFRVDRLPTAADDAHLGDGMRDGPRDGDVVSDDTPTDTAPFVACTNPILDTNFSNAGAPCTTWGVRYGSNGALASGTPNGLVVTVQNTLDSVGGCYSTMNKFVLGSGGIYALVTDALQGSSTYTVLQVHGVEYQIKVNGNGTVEFQTSGSMMVGMQTTFDPPMWFHIKPDSGDSLSGEVMSNGVWRLLGNTGSIGLPPTVDVEVSAGVNSGYSGGTGTFARLIVCP